jgi:hypothetical protein
VVPTQAVREQQAVRLVPPEPSAERARVLGSLAQLLVLVSRFVEGRGPAEEAATVALGRWDQAEQVSREGLETASSDAASVHLLLARATLELGRGDLNRAEARLRAVRRLLPTPIPEAQQAGPLFPGLAEVALWRGNLEKARALVAEAMPLVEANPRYAAPLYALGLRVEADRAELARARHLGQPAPDDRTAAALLERLGQAARGPAEAGLPELAAWHALGLAEQTRQHGRADPAAWRPRRPRGSGWASPTGPPTPGSARPRRSWPVTATATWPRWCWAAPPRSPAAWAPAPSTARWAVVGAGAGWSASAARG